MPVLGLSLLGLKHIRGFVSILRSINPTIIYYIFMYVFIGFFMEYINLNCREVDGKNSNLLWTDDIIIFSKIDFLKNTGLEFLIVVINV